jgi:hypothetical protein
LSSLSAVAIGLGVVGLVLLVMSFWWDLKNNVAAPLLGDALLKLLRADNRDRALKLCDALAPTSPYSVVARGALELRIPARDPQAGPAADYRSPVAERSFEVRVREALWMLVREGSRSIDRRVLQSIAGCAFIGAAAVLGAMSELVPFYQALGAGLAAVVIAGLNLRKRARMRGDLLRLSELLEPWVQRADA